MKHPILGAFLLASLFASLGCGSSGGGTTGSALTPGGPGGQVLFFDGDDDRAVFPDVGAQFAGATQLTIEAWIRPTELETLIAGGYPTIVSLKSDFQVSLDPDEARFFGRVGGPIQDASSPIGALTANTWHHVALVWDAPDMRVYLDGALIGSAVHPGVAMISANQAIILGDYSSHYLGYLDEVKIWSRPLTEGELQISMNTVEAAGTPDLVAYYRFNEGMGQTLEDSSGNGWHGFLGSDASAELSDPAWASAP